MAAYIDISFCLVRRPQSPLVLEFLESIQKAADPVAVETIVVDPVTDATSETINEEFARTIIFDSGRRENLPLALNRALEISQGRYIMLADEGLQVDRNALAILLAYLDKHPEVGIIGPSLTDTRNNLQASAWSYPGITTLLPGFPFPGPAIKARPGGPFAPALPVGWLSATGLIIRRETLEEIGGLDERYQQVYFDLDLCWRARRHHWHIMKLPLASMRTRSARYHHRPGGCTADLCRFLAKRCGLLPFLPPSKA